MAVAQKYEPLPHPVTPEWCDLVHAELAKKPRGEMKKLCDHLSKVLHRKVSTGHLSDTLSGKYQTSDLVEPIHKWFDWELPLQPIAAIDAGELIHLRERMTKAQQIEILDAARILRGEGGEEKKAALEALLRVLAPQND